MPKIRVLPPQLRDLIAAGEVCERPASVAKELVENALDAGAENVTVRIEQGGLGMLRVTDDGVGMSKEDAPLCFARHATSKLPFDNLSEIVTMGFRGEALAAISAVSRVVLITRERSSLEGTRAVCEAGEILSLDPFGCPTGTDITVSDLFFNTPARLKFMKRDVSEAAAAEASVEAAALAHPEVSFRVFRDGKETLHTPGDGSLLTAVYCIYGRDFAKKLMPLDYAYNGVRVKGFASKPTEGRGNRAMQFFSVNGRPIKSRMLSAALDEAYKNSMPAAKHAVAFVDISLPYDQVDVNVHPTKSEVKFVRERDVFDALYFGIKTMLAEDPVPEEAGLDPAPLPVSVPENESSSSHAGTGPRESLKPAQKENKEDGKIAAGFFAPYGVSISHTEQASASEVASPDFLAGYARKENAFLEKGGSKSIPAAPAVPSDAKDEPPARLRLVKEDEPYRLKGELFHTYLIAEGDEDAYIIDKHAAHERILYEDLLRHEGPPDSQLLLTPEVIKFSRDEYSVLLASFDELESAGFEVEDFGGGSLLVRRVPLCLAGSDIGAALSEMAESISEGKHDRRLTLRERLLYSVACRAAVKGGDLNGEEELKAILARVLDFDDIRYCPHGRPCAFRITKSELEKRFGRIGS
ncbi:MAG: DNA mismatch repair endonuclease MutL [Clostridia bacterium]|nr:DNA mismatch repair endonuclease MutL [Clostridia bacterium]